VDKSTVALFKKYKVLSKRELESRHEVFLEQYAVKINIESETAASIARTQLLPAAVRHLNELKAAELQELIGEVEPLIRELHFAILALEEANLKENQDDKTAVKWAAYMHDRVIPAMDDVRDVADRLEGLVADDLWPLPKYSEMLFIK
jgi:glutamine synthetase